MPSLDTNCLLRWVIGDVPEQTEAIQRLIDGPDRLTVTDACLLEAVFVMEGPYKLTREQIALAIGAILGEAAFDLDLPLWLGIAEDYVSHPKLSVMDVYLAHQARVGTAGPLYTFDRKLANQLAGAALLT